MIGSPIVFQTAPPQPASNARIICSPQFVGGADASQKGFIQGIPQNVVSRVGLMLATLRLQPCRNSDACTFSICDRIHNFAAAVGAISTGEKLRIRSLTTHATDQNAPSFQLNLRTISPALAKKTRMRRLSNRKNNQISVEHKVGTRLRNDRTICFSRQSRKFNSRN